MQGLYWFPYRTNAPRLRAASPRTGSIYEEQAGEIPQATARDPVGHRHRDRRGRTGARAPGRHGRRDPNRCHGFGSCPPVRHRRRSVAHAVGPHGRDRPHGHVHLRRGLPVRVVRRRRGRGHPPGHARGRARVELLRAAARRGGPQAHPPHRARRAQERHAHRQAGHRPRHAGEACEEARHGGRRHHLRRGLRALRQEHGCLARLRRQGGRVGRRARAGDAR